MSHFVSNQWLLQQIEKGSEQQGELVIVDTRYDLMDTEAGELAIARGIYLARIMPILAVIYPVPSDPMARVGDIRCLSRKRLLLFWPHLAFVQAQPLSLMMIKAA